jgi:hypothetical protein
MAGSEQSVARAFRSRFCGGLFGLAILLGLIVTGQGQPAPGPSETPPATVQPASATEQSQTASKTIGMAGVRPATTRERSNVSI